MNDNNGAPALVKFMVLLAIAAAASVGIYSHGVDVGKTEVYKLAVESGYADAIADVENGKIVYRFKVGK